MSLTLHMAAVLVGSLLVRGSQLPELHDEESRPATIVLARNAESKVTNYFTPEELRKGESDSVPATAPVLGQSGLENSRLAAADSPPPSSVTRLPQLPGPFAANGETIVLKPQASGGGGRPISRMSAADKAAILAEDAARPRAQKPTGPTARVSLFGSNEAEGRSFVFLIDRSASMGGSGLGAIEAAAIELTTSVASLEESHKFQVIAYNQKPLYLTAREMIPATAGNKQQLIDFVKNLPAFGSTGHEVGIYAALKLKPDAIFLLTDGGDPMLNTGQVKNIRAAAKGTTIHCLHFGSGPRGGEPTFLETLAELTGGGYLYVDMAERP
ncbi:MAG: VWA domain-containing protein [Pirellulaceae bacterium]|nr:VWA domain-containing protein [Pirellulaceae bacterium]